MVFAKIKLLSGGLLRFLLQPGAEAVAGLIAVGFAIIVAGISIDGSGLKASLFVMGGALIVIGFLGAVALSVASGDLHVVPEIQGKSAVLSVKNRGALSVKQLTAEGYIYFGAPREDEREYPIRWRGNTSPDVSLGSNGGHNSLDIAVLSSNFEFRFFTAQQLLANEGTSNSFPRKQIETDGFIIRVNFTAVEGLKSPLTKHYQLRMNDVPNRGFHEVRPGMSDSEMRRAEDDKVPFILFEEITEQQAIKIRR